MLCVTMTEKKGLQACVASFQGDRQVKTIS